MTQTNKKKLVGWTMYVTSVVMPLSAYPQINQLYSTHVTSGLSLATWIMYLFFGLIPLAYALVYNLRPLIISNILWTGVNLIMIFGIIKYGVLVGEGSFDRLLLINNVGKVLSGIGLICVSAAFALYAYDLVERPRLKGRAA